MKSVLILFFLLSYSVSFAQQVDSISIPKRVVYKYTDPAVIAKAKEIIAKELSDQREYALIDNVLFVGPGLWMRFSKVKTLEKIEGGNVTHMVDNYKLPGKMTQSIENGKKVWDQVCKEVKGKKYILRKLTYDELEYYWSVIAFDIEEPLLVLETDEHKYILNLSPKTYKLFNLDGMPEKR
ncbi:MAG: hypothetical protein JWM14_818 [Chitinophagaceae bacterium]|nr:hypothetical protein [Chitinophagaceae bacterium]